jgi:hypothetical protein
MAVSVPSLALVNLGAIDGDVSGCFNSEAHLVPDDPQDRDGDIFPDVDGFRRTAGENEHAASFLQLSAASRTLRRSARIATNVGGQEGETDRRNFAHAAQGGDSISMQAHCAGDAFAAVAD